MKQQDIGAMHDRDLARAIDRYTDTMDRTRHGRVMPKTVTVRTLNIDNVLKVPITLQGVTLDALVNVVVKQQGNQAMEIDWFDMHEVYICVPTMPDAMLLDQDALKSRHKGLYEDFIAECEVIAIRRAQATSDDKWDTEEIETGDRSEPL